MRIVAVLLAIGLALAGCSSSDGSPSVADPTSSPTTEATTSTATPPTAEPTDDPGTVVQITVKDGRVTPQGSRVEAKVGEPITLEISSDAAEEIHVHSRPEHEYEVGAGDAVTKTFTIDTPGQVAVEAHELGVTIVQLVVRP